MGKKPATIEMPGLTGFAFTGHGSGERSMEADDDDLLSATEGAVARNRAREDDQVDDDDDHEEHAADHQQSRSSIVAAVSLQVVAVRSGDRPGAFMSRSWLQSPATHEEAHADEDDRDASEPG